ncbi:MAG: GntG family PLP-dependent aldolase [Casimicrobiaceae bacterium]
MVERPPIVDLRSDFLTRPTAAMNAAMFRAAGRPAAFGLREDPDQQALEREVALLLGMEDALLFPTCSMANEVALMLLASPGDMILAQPDVHILTSEGGAAAALGGLQIVAVPGASPCPPVEAWEALARQQHDELHPRAVAVALENTHNRAGGMAWPVGYGRTVLAVAARYELRAHLDGARLFNAAVALGTSAAELCAGFDTVAVNFNKGLGAPVGAALAGSAASILRALRLRQRFGGGMRPTGIIAAAAREALADFSHLADDHRRARVLASALANIPGIRVDPAQVVTNIVVLNIDPTAEEACTALEREGVRVLPFGERRLRLVTYRNIGDEDIARVITAFRSVFRVRTVQGTA